MKRLIAANSFTEKEIGLLTEILTFILRGGDPKMLARTPEFKSIARKQYAMSQHIKLLKEGNLGIRKDNK